jgi:hypothetical protein
MKRKIVVSSSMRGIGKLAAHILHHRRCNELRLVQQERFAAAAFAKKISKKDFLAFPQGNACASMPSSQLKFFCCCSSFTGSVSPI